MLLAHGPFSVIQRNKPISNKDRCQYSYKIAVYDHARIARLSASNPLSENPLIFRFQDISRTLIQSLPCIYSSMKNTSPPREEKKEFANHCASCNSCAAVSVCRIVTDFFASTKIAVHGASQPALNAGEAAAITPHFTRLSSALKLQCAGKCGHNSNPLHFLRLFFCTKIAVHSQ